MKKKAIIILLSSILIIAALISSCTSLKSPSTSDSNSPSGSQADQDKISALEAKILTLIENQQLSDAERQKEISKLKSEIEQLKSESNKSPSGSESKDESENESTDPPSNTFKYTVNEGKAIITEITAVSDSVNIPSTIDGYAVYAIGSEALSSKTVKTVVISSGIEKLDWFAFRNCISLSSISIPSSVTSIGYGAFDNVSKSLTIKCQKNSFAHQYAQSYGLTYDIT